jgi:hypothetical protein
MSSTSNALESPWRAGLHSARANLLPGLVLQAGALALVLAYYRHAPTRAMLEQLTTLRSEVGVIFPICSTGFFGGLLPFAVMKLQRSTRSRYTWRQGGVIAAFWAYKGFEVDLWYRALARVFGEQHDAATIVIKSLCDQFIYCPIVAVPFTALVYEWTETHFDRAALVADVRAGGWYRRRILPLLISNLGVWLPAVGIIYSLPTALQLPLQNLVLCFFTLLVAHQVSRQPLRH